MRVGGSAGSLMATIAPSDATNQGVAWVSSAPGVASVVGSGLGATVTAVSAGTATITVTANDTANGVKAATCAITVVRPVIGSTLSDRFLIDVDGRLWRYNSVSTVRVGTDADWMVVLGGDSDRAIKTDGSLWDLGSVPTRVGTDTDWVAAFGFGAIKTDGSLWTWGRNEFYQLGLGDTLDRDVPTRVGTDADWVAATSSWRHTLALKADGSLWGWGYNVYYPLGSQAGLQVPVPTRVGTATDWAVVSTGSNHTLALKTDGSLWAWGHNYYGAIGLGYTGGSNIGVPTRVGTDADWVAVRASNFHSLALKADGSLWAWGNNDYHDGYALVQVGELGLGDTLDQNVPVPTRVGTDADWVAMAVCHALKSDGSLWAWGSGIGGLGDNAGRHVPTRVCAVRDWAAASPGGHTTLAIKTDGSLWAWGDESSQALGVWGGYVTTHVQGVPTRVGTGTDWVAVSAKSAHALALKADGSLWAWGNDGEHKFGYLGLGDTYGTGTPTKVGTDTDWVAVSTDHRRSLALKTDGSLWAWGRNYCGALGFGDTADRNVPTRVGADADWVAVAMGFDTSTYNAHALALKTDGSLWAWGDNYYGQLGLGDSGSSANRNVPTRVGTGNDWTAVSAGKTHSLALKADGSLWAWGHNHCGQLGLGDTADRNVPARVGAESDWIAVSAGQDLALALKVDGSLWAWGDNRYYGQLGLGDSGSGTNRSVPTRVGADNDWAAAVTGGDHSLALKTDGSSWVWGSNSYGQLGLGDSGSGTDRNTPVCLGPDPDYWP
jgi:alpha-tubulin suppressor-like RCC1 family protein